MVAHFQPEVSVAPAAPVAQIVPPPVTAVPTIEPSMASQDVSITSSVAEPMETSTVITKADAEEAEVNSVVTTTDGCCRCQQPATEEEKFLVCSECGLQGNSIFYFFPCDHFSKSCSSIFGA